MVDDHIAPFYGVGSNVSQGDAVTSRCCNPQFIQILDAVAIISIIPYPYSNLVLTTLEPLRLSSKKGKFNTLIKEGMEFDQALFEAGKSRFRAIFLTSLTTIAGLAPLLLEQGRQAQFLKPMAISISYGIGIATLLTLLLLPLFLSFGNHVKLWIHWLRTGEKVETTAVTSAYKEQQSLKEYEDE